MAVAVKNNPGKSATRTRVKRQAVGAQDAFFPARQKRHEGTHVTTGGDGSFFQAKLTINQIDDPLEVEADRVAEDVTRSIHGSDDSGVPPPVPPASGEEDGSGQGNDFFQRKPAFDSPTELDLNSAVNPDLQRAPGEGSMSIIAPPSNPPTYDEEWEGGGIQRKAGPESTPALDQADGAFESRLRSTRGSGVRLPEPTRLHMESAFETDFSDVRVHTGSEAESLNNQVYARAFTHGKDIYFNRGQYRPDSKEGTQLLAHELTHVVQQGAAGKQQPVQRSPKVSGRSSTTMVQRLGISDVLDYFADKANNIPGFAMLTVILGFNPINGANVTRNAANIFRGIMGFLPGGNLIWEALNNHGIFGEVGAWIEQKLDELGDIGNSISNAIDTFIDSLSFSDIFSLGSVWRRAKRIFTDPIDRIINFVRGLVTDILKFIRDAILRPLAGLAEGTRGWDLLIAVLGFNPITGDAVPRTAETLIGGFMKLIGQEEVWANIQRANAIPRAWAWFQGALGQLIGFVSRLPTLFIQTLKSLEIIDMVLVPRAFIKVGKVFLGFAADFAGWALNAVWDLLKIIFEVVAPGAIPYLNKTADAFKGILANPAGFLGNLVNAGKLGFNLFKENIGTILKDVLIDWLLGTLAGAGIYIPQGLTFVEILKFILSVLGITWENIRAKLVEHFGEGPVVVLEEGFVLIKTLITEGPAAAWEIIKQHLATLQETVISEIISYVTQTVVAKAVIKIVSSLNPVGAFVQAILTIYDVILVFIQRIQKIIQVGMAFLDSVVEIASGNIMPAAQKIVNTLKGILVLAISFLAGFAGLGKISDAIKGVLKKVRDPVDKAMDKLIGWVASKAKGFLKKKDEDNHQEIVNAAVEEMEQGGGGATSYAELRQAKEAQARQIEDKYKGQLKEGIGITITFSPPSSDPDDQDLDFSVIIAPNATKGDGALPLAELPIPPELVPGLRLKPAGGGSLQVIKKVDPTKRKIDVAATPTATVLKRIDLDPFIQKFNSGQLEIVEGFVQDDVPAVTLEYTLGSTALNTIQQNNLDLGEAITEYKRQLNLMQTAMNALPVGTWKANIDGYDPSQRSDSQIRSAFREKYKQAKLAEIKAKAQAQGKPIKDDEAQQQVELHMEGKAALHLDMIIGGNENALLDMGVSSINSSIGGVNLTKAKQKLLDAYDPFIEQLSETEKQTLKMNVTFVYV